jgi:hypothetical protein
MIRSAIIGMIAAGALSGCAVTGDDAKLEQSDARRKFELARTFEASSNFREAAHEYLIVAESYPGSDVWPQAVRKTGVLHADPRNPGRNDSLALRWLGVYAVLATSPAEKDLIQSTTTAIAWRAEVEQQLERQRRATDSLSGVIRRLSGSLAVQSRQNEDLEARLRKTADELKKLKEIDVRTSRKKRQP